MLIPIGFLGAGAKLPAYELISTQLISGDTTAVTFSSITSTYQHLQLRAVIRSSNASYTEEALIRFNGDSGTNYNYHHIDANGSTISPFGVADSSSIKIGNLTGTNPGTSVFTPYIIDILDYANTSKYKTLKNLQGRFANYSNVRLTGGAWRSLSALNSITLSLDYGTNIGSGSRISLYGVRA